VASSVRYCQMMAQSMGGQVSRAAWLRSIELE
jgi:hypothetical protein